MAVNIQSPPTYPARPFNGGGGGHLDPDWSYSPKLNGWRVVVHTPTGRCFNRQGGFLSIRHEFDKALQILQALSPFDWLDCEGLSRRHGVGKGTLFVLDAMDKSLQFRNRKSRIEESFPVYEMGDEPNTPTNSVFTVPEFSSKGAREIWMTMLYTNKTVETDFYEGLVGKQSTSRYPFQLFNPDRPCDVWVKHRFPHLNK